jgi:cell division protein FtsQ
MARRRKRDYEEDDDEQGVERRRNLWPALRFMTLTLASVVAVFGAGWAAWQVQQIAVSDAHFRFAPDGAPTEQALTISGVQNASRAAILRVFADDQERSVARIDIEARRRQLRQVEWVKDASVRRIWPNRLAVTITERTPVAFIEVPSGDSGGFVPALIDDEGAILRSRVPVKSTLPLLVGVRASDNADVLRDRVRRLRGLMTDLGELAARVEEVDVTEPGNLRIAYNVGEMQVVLILGEDNFRKRLNLFLKHYPDLRDRISARQVLDVSLDERVIAR